MKVNEKRIFPYPVYCEGSDDYKIVGFDTNTELLYNSVIATIQIKIAIEDEAINLLLENNQVGLFCHVECAKTKYRELFELDGTDKELQAIDIDLSKLNGDIEIMCFLVAKEEIPNFQDENLIDFYQGQSVRFPKYARIGYSNPFETKIIKHLDINGEVPSIFSVQADATVDMMTYETTQNKIIILLPTDEHDIYSDYLGVDPKTKLMMMNLAVLTEIIQKIQVDAEEFESNDWFEVIRESFAKKGFSDLTATAFTTKSAVELAQILMPELCKNAFKEFDKSHSDGTKGE
jgi:hypothetical protein